MATNNADWLPRFVPPVRLKEQRYTYPSVFRDTKPLSTNPRKFAIELRDKQFNLKARIEPFVTSCRWEWNRIGGCGQASIRVSGDYNRFNVEADDDIRIWLPDENGTSASLWYRGYVEAVNFNLQGGDQSINLECTGYFSWMERINVHSSGSVKTYTGTEISAIVQSIINTYVAPVTSIRAGLIEQSSYVPDTLSFKNSVGQVLDTLFDLLGNVEYGVDQDLTFYWFNQNDRVTHKFYLGDKITQVGDQRNFRGIVNSILFEGGKVGTVAFTTSAESTDSITRYGRHEKILSNGSITTLGVATQYMNGILSQKAKPQLPLSVQIVNTNKRLEQVKPIGAIGIIDSDIAQTAAVWGKTASGGSNKIYGKIVNSGSGQLYGGTRKDQVDRIQYNYEPENGRVSATIAFGDTSDLSRAAATLKQMELVQETVRQRSL